MTLSNSADRSIWIWLAAARDGSAIDMISRRTRAVRVATTIGRISRERSETMMKATGRTVVQVLSGSMRQTLRRSVGNVRFNPAEDLLDDCSLRSNMLA